ncbi:hypothetical protein GGI15_004241 [Coemansia interrupta]|uniref:Uncharacterized protein n=1 Tax=Coemansia interrupta TaxID=1126814 RepID=A0A9W8LGH6_9FUNG|nr:hypothetical protein GGI15_004241 [Coemansia interrupta]
MSKGGAATTESKPLNDETRPLLQFRPYCPPPAPLSPEDIIQRKRSLGIVSLYTEDGDGLSALSMSFSSILGSDADDDAERGKHSKELEGVASVDQSIKETETTRRTRA